MSTSPISTGLEKTSSTRSSTFSNLFHKKPTEETGADLTNSIQDYQILKKISGVEDISFLYLAKHIPTGKVICLKFTDLHLSTDYELIDEVINNVKNSKMLKHHNIMPAFVIFVNESHLWTATIAVYGTMRSIMSENFPYGFSEPTVATILKEAIKGIAYIHENHMIHNDIKADNILLDLHGEVRVCGFRQMANLQQGGHYINSTFSLVGDNIEWAAPEVMTQNSNYTQSADIYSLGITALELAFNQTPFDGWPPLKILLCKTEYGCPNIRNTKQFSKNFYKFVQACVQKDAKLRYQVLSRPTIHECLEHPFFKQAKNGHFLEQVIMKQSNSG
jgi:serine/threonine protein kinase